MAGQSRDAGEVVPVDLRPGHFVPLEAVPLTLFPGSVNSRRLIGAHSDEISERSDIVDVQQLYSLYSYFTSHLCPNPDPQQVQSVRQELHSAASRHCDFARDAGTP